MAPGGEGAQATQAKELAEVATQLERRENPRLLQRRDWRLRELLPSTRGSAVQEAVSDMGASRTIVPLAEGEVFLNRCLRLHQCIQIQQEAITQHLEYLLCIPIQPVKIMRPLVMMRFITTQLAPEVQHLV